ncbi:fumarylacetoacetate hydrolase family protein [Oceanicella actignis]|uniref:2-keto-4-pentenoate hydratase/2-oxohepta-3-ene-1,7-dioic acid hydratase (Catechol pathway) n=1 Tax=Oceanicella actignis TaxID=1189325 RepID=A0A1M7TL10_9RHOB|nr:fumarylacetoacetate hydrolase family protein [Oceanicella actignis]TYO88279.1 2-keto-4-pentenoate hydratase/2-oxohepta-3-ene-1,7-dioic acid hydratase in catechol pathway [Oceanicella actignis]SET69073.1 2-keto-4-pentenoate hydratase/2-oxohepta-3-ene-1,7-dioic acid hydratase (catechol pathway) [Oceanicella actignis]SHN71395.1 2-keto-4-pentenoate hydratase/2-oxohepta-3-ene-1,7-dioic acid hydratase (catechol pathway) [Oceanicella actignis]
MKLLRWGPRGAEKPGLLDAEGQVRDLSAHVSDLAGDAVSLRALDRLRALRPEDLPVVEAERLGACLAWVPNFHCVGLNYARHAAEAGAQPPAEPVLFSKATTALAGPFDPIVIPKGSVKTDWEVELGVVIGAEVEHVSEAEALSCVAGYCVVNDLSERAWQLEGTGQWSKGKSAPGFGPIGPWLVTADEVPDPQDLPLWLDLNGETQQLSSTADMIFSVAEIISYMSRHMRLRPGDIIATGTPEGVGMGQTPQRFLRPGDVLELGVTGLGDQRQTALAWPG